ncbi:MAG: sulfate respiration complex protein HmcC [Pseudomonadota bacterium]|uniref:Polysulfide reductase NrfD n=1 Tax=Candidatus Desulfatibia profunda TaxID=2841695 RepID=A0A8J6NS05_9BACT|nr:polysulfide reductase NrfD [Candidatus Desulfatibia profunda]MBL7180229.1 polysulfide reductase NrfD [Desulfobacterales bacterium]
MTKTPGPEAKSVFSAFDLVAGIIMLVGGILTVLRFTGGLGAVTHLDDNNPWGFWIGFDLLCGDALAAGGCVTSAACFIFGLKRYHSAVRPAMLAAFLGYALVVLALVYDVGRPWRLPYPIFISQGTSSLLLVVALCACFYLFVLAIENTPAVLEWLGWRKARNLLVKLTLALTIFGVILSTLHQSSLGALFLIAPSKLHPLWYSAYLPIYFFISSMFAGMSMVIFESTLAHRFLRPKMDQAHLAASSHVTFGFGKAAAFVMAGYVMIQFTGLAADNDWGLLISPWGMWYLLELIGFVALPAFVYAIGVRERNIRLIRWAALWTVLGIFLNRLNVCLIAFNWQLPADQRYFPKWMEIATTIFIVTIGIVAYRFIATRMPILYEHPDYQHEH